MNYKKNTLVDMDDDLKFIPLNLKEPFKSKDSSWAPCINKDVETTNMTTNFFIGLPDLQTTQSFTPLPNINANPTLPYTSTILTPSLYGSTNNNIVDKYEPYPSEVSENELYSYNEDTNINTSIDRFTNNITHLDILRDFDLSIDSDITNDTRCCSCDDIDKIFKDIEENNGGLLCTLKSYKIPYPIATLIIKKIIKLTLDYSMKE